MTSDVKLLVILATAVLTWAVFSRVRQDLRRSWHWRRERKRIARWKRERLQMPSNRRVP